MRKYFVNYEIAQQLLEIGFDLECFCVVWPDEEISPGGKGWTGIMQRRDHTCICCPSWEQARDFMESKGFYIANSNTSFTTDLTPESTVHSMQIMYHNGIAPTTKAVGTSDYFTILAEAIAECITLFKYREYEKTSFPK